MKPKLLISVYGGCVEVYADGPLPFEVWLADYDIAGTGDGDNPRCAAEDASREVYDLRELAVDVQPRVVANTVLGIPVPEETGDGPEVAV